MGIGLCLIPSTTWADTAAAATPTPTPDAVASATPSVSPTPPIKCSSPNDSMKPSKKLPAIPDVKYPYTFICDHCGIKVTVKSPADWMKPCPACECSVHTIDCLPKPKKAKVAANP